MGLLSVDFDTVKNKRIRNADRILPSEELNLRGLLDAATNVPVVGDALSGGLALYDAAKGDYGSAALNALGVLPFLSAGMIKGTGKVADVLNAKHSALDGFISESPKQITLSKIVVPKELRNQGQGTAFMNDLVSEADKVGKTVALTPSSDFGGSKARLQDFYKRFGFVPNKGKTADYEISEAMYRNPQPDAVNTPKLTEFDKYKSTFDDISSQVEKAKANFAADRSRANLDEYNRLLQKRDDAQSMMEQWRPKEAQVDSYQGQHSAPMKDSGAPLNNITKDGYYPEDVYGPNGLRYYGTGDDKLDAAAYSVIRQAQGNPFAQVKMYRAVPSDAPAVINNGDWVTTVRQYAKDHGDSALNGDYRIVSKTVPAKKLFTNGDSWLEFGYDQSGKINPALLGAIAGGGLLGLGGYKLMNDN